MDVLKEIMLVLVACSAIGLGLVGIAFAKPVISPMTGLTIAFVASIIGFAWIMNKLQRWSHGTEKSFLKA